MHESCKKSVSLLFRGIVAFSIEQRKIIKNQRFLCVFFKFRAFLRQLNIGKRVPGYRSAQMQNQKCDIFDKTLRLLEKMSEIEVFEKNVETDT